MQVAHAGLPGGGVFVRLALRFFMYILESYPFCRKGGSSKPDLETTFMYLVGSLFKLYGNCDCGPAGIGIPELSARERCLPSTHSCIYLFQKLDVLYIQSTK